MTYIVHINPIPGTQEPNRTVEVEAETFYVDEGVATFHGHGEQPQKTIAAFASGVWNYVEPKK